MARESDLMDAVRGLSDPLVVMRRVVDQALVLVPPADGAVVELAEDGVLTYVCAAGSLAGHVGTRVEMGKSLSGLAVRSGETLRCVDCATDARVDAAACRRVGASSMVCVPLRRAHEPIGVLKVTASRANAFADADVALLAGLAEFVSATIGSVRDISRVVGKLSPDPPRNLDAASARERSPDPSGERSTVATVDEFVANVLRPGVAADVAARQRVEAVLAAESLRVDCQPIVEIDNLELVGFEALARFPEHRRAPDVWFDEAHQVGLGVELQLAAVKTAMKVLKRVPEHAFLAVNLGPDAIAAPEVIELLDAHPERIVIELTEHRKIDDYPKVRAVLKAIRDRGIRLAIDDTGAGFASLGHILHLAPDLIKLDRQFTRGIDLDPVRRALAQALVAFANDTGAQVIAEGIETADELETLKQLGIPFGQGYLIGRPGPIAAVALPAVQPPPPGCLVDPSTQLLGLQRQGEAYGL